MHLTLGCVWSQGSVLRCAISAVLLVTTHAQVTTPFARAAGQGAGLAAGPAADALTALAPLAAGTMQASALSPTVQVVGAMGADPVTRAAVAPKATEILANVSKLPVTPSTVGTASPVAMAAQRTQVKGAIGGSARGVAQAASEPSPATIDNPPAAQQVIASLGAQYSSSASSNLPAAVPPSTDANSSADAAFQNMLTGVAGGYQPVPLLVRGPSRPLTRKRTPANAVFTLTGSGARLNGANLLIFGASPAVSFISSAPVYRAGVLNTSFFAANLTSPGGWLGNPDAVLYGTREGKSVAVVLNVQAARYESGLFLATVNLLPRDFGPLFSNGIVAQVQSNALAETDGNGLTILNFLPGGVKWENVALVVETVLEEFRPAPGGKARPVVKGDAGSQMSCSSASLWKPAFCATP
eukprot:jgi/Botrbrau1/8142/Bobra.0308s0032.1